MSREFSLAYEDSFCHFSVEFFTLEIKVYIEIYGVVQFYPKHI